MPKFWNEYAPLPLRLLLGGSLSISGFVKLFSAQGRANIEYLLAQLGVPAPGFMKWVVGLVEFSGGVLLLLGAFTLVASVVNILNLVVLQVMGWWNGGLPQPQPPLAGFPWAFPDPASSLVGIAALLALYLGGAGIWSVDRLRARHRAQTQLAQAEL
jgi:putative oxidoreductase